MGTTFDYVVIGHVTRDLADGDFTVGGTVSYAARTAYALGCRVGVITSASTDLDLDPVLDGVVVSRLAAPNTTTFENTYTPDGRHQVIHGVAERLTPQQVPADWRATVIHLGPVAGECDPALASRFEDAFLGLSPQGWMRRWDQQGRITAGPWAEAAELLTRADAVVLSEEDVASDPTLIERFAAQTRVLVKTQASAGCTVYVNGRSRHVAAPVKMHAADATGAGDIFAAAFFIWLQRSGDPWAAARFANCIAGQSVTRIGLAGTPTAKEAAHCRQAVENRTG